MLLLAAGCAGRAGSTRARGPALQRYQYAQLHMGVQVRLVVYAPSREAAERACEAAYARVAQLEDVFSDYRPTSELMRLCDKAGGAPVLVSDELIFVLQRAQDVSRRSDGAFDVTVGPYVRLWREGRKTGKLPSHEALAAAREKVGWRFVRIHPDRKTVRLAVPGMRLDLGGIAKGYAGDEAIRVLRDHGIASALFEAGGDIVVSDAPPGERGWKIELPENAAGDEPTLTLANAAVSTSGDTEQFVEIDGKRYSHVVDPRIGIGLTDRTAATVIAKDGITSDSLSTAACVLGSEKGQALANSYDDAKVMVRKAD